MKMVLASNNAGKLAELQTMFGKLNVQLIRQSELNISEAEEPYKTFVENALAKARHASGQSGLPAVADDAGLLQGAGPDFGTGLLAETEGGVKLS